MTFRTLGRIIKLGLLNFWRNKWLSLAATLIMTLTILTISIFLILTLVINTTTQAVKEKIDLTVTFNDSASETQILALQNILSARPDTKMVKYISKDEAYENWLTLQTSEKVKNLVTRENNPLPRSLQVKASNPESLENIANFISAPDYQEMIRTISYQKNKHLIERLISITKFVKKIGWILSATFVAISILVILNTIRLTIFTRREEIEIMRLVGANNSFIRIPFVIEGMLYGILATIVATLALWLGIYLISPIISQYLGDVNLNLMGFFQNYLPYIVLLELATGIVIGVTCSLVSIQRHIRI